MLHTHAYTHVRIYTYTVYSSCGLSVNEMSLLCFFKPKDGFPDLRGALFTSVTYAAIVQANQEVQKATSSEKQSGPYKKYSAGLSAEIGK